MKHTNHLILRVIMPLLLLLPAFCLLAQPDVEPWGNMNGIRVDGQLMEFGTTLRIAGPDGTANLFTGKERQNPRYMREGKKQVINTRLDSIYIKETVEDAGKGMARVDVVCTAHGDVRMKGAFFTINSPHRQVEVRPDTGDVITGQKIDLPLYTGDMPKGQTAHVSFLITVTGEVDRQSVHLVLNTAVAGRVFEGLGGNFRIQNPALDPKVISYCLEHLRVAWGRVELPWRSWQPVKDSKPMDSARLGRLAPGVVRAMEMARTLGEKKIPVIVSAWFPPDWAIEGPVRFRPGPDHIWGNALNKNNMEEVYRSIADYIAVLKEQYKVEVSYFSFNESDLGINVRQTAQEHDGLIKGLGAYFASRGLATKVLLGDNSDATTYSFIGPAMEDPAARPYIGAVSFHSWRGWDTATLKKWADAATKLQLPLLVGEGSIDAAAWNYPAIFLEPGYAMKEIGLYIRLLAICQPASILQWQLTSDYSLLAGGGLFGDTSALHPTQRFWNLRQLSMTPPGLAAMPLTCDRPYITVAAVGNNEQHRYAVHLVNDGATREVVLQGLPADVKTLRFYITNETYGASEGKRINVKAGEAKFTLGEQSYVTLVSL